MNLRARAVHRTAVSAALASAALLTGASAAQAACATTATAKTFSKLGDTADYSLAPGGNFESGASGWSLGGASVVSGNESLFLGSTRDAKSLAIPAKAVPVSAPFCVGVEHPTFRFVARRTSGTWGVLLVKLRVTDSTGRVNDTTIASLNGSAYNTWAATPPLHLATVLSLWAAGQSTTARIIFDPDDQGGAWQVDDIYIDPYRRS